MKAVPFGKIAKIFNGNSISVAEKDKHYRGVSGTPYIGTAEVGFDTAIDYHSGVAIPDEMVGSFRIAKAGTPLVCAEGGSAGRKIGITDRSVCFGNKLFAIEVSADWDGRFLFYFCQSEAFQQQFRALMTGMIGGVSIKKFKEIQIPVFPLPEQQRVVGILDQAFEGIAKAKANAEQNRVNAWSIFQTFLDESFSESLSLGDPKTVDQVCDIRGGKRVPKGYKFETEPTSYRYATVTSFGTDGSINVENTNFISSNIFDSLKRYEIKPGDIYISIAGTVGRSGIFPSNIDRCILTENACRMIPKSNAYSRYIYLYMQSSHFMDQVAESTRTAAQPKLALERLKSIFIPLDPMEKQVEMAERLFEIKESTAELEGNCARKIEELDDLKSSILHQAFSGKL